MFLAFTFAMSLSVRLYIVCNVHARYFGNVSMPFGTLAIHDLSVKILRRSFQGNPSVRGVKHKRGSRIAILDVSNAISRKRCKIGA